MKKLIRKIQEVESRVKLKYPEFDGITIQSCDGVMTVYGIKLISNDYGADDNIHEYINTLEKVLDDIS